MRSWCVIVTVTASFVAEDVSDIILYILSIGSRNRTLVLFEISLHRIYSPSAIPIRL